jgi:hypothetical protein
MQQLLEKSQYILLEDIKRNPSLIAQLFFKDNDVSIIFEKQGDKVRYSYLKIYSKKSVRILEEAKKEFKEIEGKGYTREQAFADFTEARNEISKYL